MRRLALVPLLALVAASASAQSASAQSAPQGPPRAPLTRADAVPPRTADERAVWALIQRGSAARPALTDDYVFVSGAYPRPMRLARASEPGAAGAAAVARPSPDSTMQVAQQAVNQRRNQTTKVTPVRVTVANGGDMAYGVAFVDMTFDAPDSTGRMSHVQFEATELTVWRKIDGQWRLAALFARPNR